MKTNGLRLLSTLLVGLLLAGCGGGGGGTVGSGTAGAGTGSASTAAVSEPITAPTGVPIATPTPPAPAEPTPTPTPTPLPETTSTLLVKFSDGYLPAGTTTVIATAYDATGAVVFGPVETPVGAELAWGAVPNTATMLQLAYWAGQTQCVGLSSIALSLGNKMVSFADPPVDPAVTLTVTGRMSALVNATWVAAQDGRQGEWRMYSPTYAGKYAFAVRDRDGAYGIAAGVLVTHGGSGGGSSAHTVVFEYATMTETATPTVRTELEGTTSGAQGGSTTKIASASTPTNGVTVSGTAAGMGAGTNGRVFLTSKLTADLADGGGAYSIANVLPGHYGIAALKGVGYRAPDVDNSKIDAIFLGSLNISGTGGDVTYDVDFNDATRTRTPVDATVTLLGGGTDTVDGMVSLAMPRESKVPLGTFDGVAQKVAYKGCPTTTALAAAQGGGGEEEETEVLHVVTASATGPEEAGGTSVRTITHYFSTPSDLDETFGGPNFGAVTMGPKSVGFGQLAGSDIYRAELADSAEEATTSWTVNWTPGWLGAGPGYQYDFVDISAFKGLDATWMYPANALWTTSSVIGGGTMPLETLMAGVGEGSDGMRVVTMGRKGQLGP
jgi:hypothetical protein